MKIDRLLGLLLLWMDHRVNGEETISSFMRDMMADFQLYSPTIVYEGDEAPEICYTDQWVLCLSSHSQFTENDPKVAANRVKKDNKVTKDGKYTKLPISHTVSSGIIGK